MHVLVTGGAGFVGSFVVEALAAAGHRVRVLDALEAQVHGGGPGALTAAGAGVEMRLGDVRDLATLRDALQGVDAVVHFAAQVGVGQSMYEVTRYVDHNVGGTGTLLELLAAGEHGVRRLVVASSMSIYGEGAYRCARCGDVAPAPRPRDQMARGDWELHCPVCHDHVVPMPTPETKPLAPTSVYAITKQTQESLCLAVGRAYGIPTVALRFFNIYGPRQALSNPYTGLAAIFTSRLLNGRAPVVFEDGGQSRDFVHVRDVVQATLLALTHQDARWDAFNVGTGRGTTVGRVAELLAERMGFTGGIRIERTFREGDIRHCIADIGAIGARFGYAPTVRIEEGIDDLIAWARTQQAEDHFERAAAELAARRLTR